MYRRNVNLLADLNNSRIVGRILGVDGSRDLNSGGLVGVGVRNALLDGISVNSGGDVDLRVVCLLGEVILKLLLGGEAAQDRGQLSSSQGQEPGMHQWRRDSDGEQDGAEHKHSRSTWHQSSQRRWSQGRTP